MNLHEDDESMAVSTAELTMETLGHVGRTWHVPKLRWEDPTRVEVHRPVNEFVRHVLREARPDGENDWRHIHVMPCDWDLRESGSGQAITDGLNKIGLAGEETNDVTLLHECAHILRYATDYPNGGGHGPEFQTVVAALYRQHLSPDAADVFELYLTRVRNRLAGNENQGVS